MCGIIGYKGKGEISKILVEGIKRLEYRGYDSVGFATIVNDQIIVQKSVGRLDEVKKNINVNLLKGGLGIAHTRWSTHGKVTVENAHPHLSCDKNIAIAHNGIIENFHELKNELINKGHRFSSDTDSEVVAHLIEDYIKKFDNIKEAVKSALLKLKGTYALAIISKGENKLIGARSGSPLIIGIGSGEYFLSSDVQAFIDHTKSIVRLENNEMVIIGEDVIIENVLTNERRNFEIEELKCGLWDSEKSNFKHFMLKEIYEQPEALKKTFTFISEQIKDLKIQSFKKIIIVACGTAYFAGLIGTYLLEKFLGVDTECQYASEFRYRDLNIKDKTLIMAISQSGETADTLEAAREAKKKGAFVLSICNVIHSALARESDLTLFTQAGPEISVASTKAFTTQILAIIVFCLNFVKKKELTNLFLKEVIEVFDLIEKVLKRYGDIEVVAEKCYKSGNFLFFGRGILYPVALEGALKLKEISYIHAEGLPAAELKHGHIALIDDKTPSLFLALKNNLYNKVLNNIMEVKSRGGRVIAVTTDGNSELEGVVDDVIYIPKVSDFLSPIVGVIPLQLLSYIIALKRGCDIDKPRNLAKVVTVE